MRVASFNVENLFEGAVALVPSDWSKGRPALEAYTRINQLLNKLHYTNADKAQIVELLKKLGLNKKDDGGKYARLRQNRGRLLTRRKVGNGTRIEIVADGRADWIGWVELSSVFLGMTRLTPPEGRAVGRSVLSPLGRTGTAEAARPHRQKAAVRSGPLQTQRSLTD